MDDELHKWLWCAYIFVGLLHAMRRFTTEQMNWAVDELNELQQERCAA
jgi:hypothetical protein